jgi:hypothetical protein
MTVVHNYANSGDVGVVRLGLDVALLDTWGSAGTGSIRMPTYY